MISRPVDVGRTSGVAARLPMMVILARGRTAEALKARAKVREAVGAAEAKRDAANILTGFCNAGGLCGWAEN